MTRDDELPPGEEPATDQAGWHRDPEDPSVRRWWDGASWTGEVHPKPQPQTPPTHTVGSTARLGLDMWTADAVVLLDWLQEVDFEALPVTHKSQKQALTDLLELLEVCVVPPDEDEIRVAQLDVARDMGW